MRHSYFKNRNCYICKAQATIHRTIGWNNKKYFLCDSHKCNLFTLIKKGLFKVGIVGERLNGHI